MRWDGAGEPKHLEGGLRGPVAFVIPSVRGQSSKHVPRTSSMTTLYLVRHGETEWNSAHRIQGRTDIALSEIGQAQADNLRRRFQDIPLDQVYSSPLLRARQTAEHIVAGRPLSVTFDAALAERSLGEWEGLLFDDIDARFPEERKAWAGDPAFTPAGGESLVEVWDRCHHAWRRALLGASTSSVLLVTHAYVARILLGMASGLPRETPWVSYAFSVSNASVSVIDVFPARDGQGPALSHILSLNDVSHLKHPREAA